MTRDAEEKEREREEEREENEDTSHTGKGREGTSKMIELPVMTDVMTIVGGVIDC